MDEQLKNKIITQLEKRCKEILSNPEFKNIDFQSFSLGYLYGSTEKQIVESISNKGA